MNLFVKQSIHLMSLNMKKNILFTLNNKPNVEINLIKDLIIFWMNKQHMYLPK